jgi:hypothetical protein
VESRIGEIERGREREREKEGDRGERGREREREREREMKCPLDFQDRSQARDVSQSLDG